MQEPRSSVKGAEAKSSRATIVKSVNYECGERDVVREVSDAGVESVSSVSEALFRSVQTTPDDLERSNSFVRESFTHRCA